MAEVFKLYELDKSFEVNQNVRMALQAIERQIIRHNAAVVPLEPNIRNAPEKELKTPSP